MINDRHAETMIRVRQQSFRMLASGGRSEHCRIAVRSRITPCTELVGGLAQDG